MDYFLAEENAPGLIRLANMATLGKNVAWTYKEFKPSPPWAISAVLARHSTLDWASLVFVDSVRSDVGSQIVRHTREYPRFAMQSWRPDWTNKPRPRNPEELRMLASKWPVRALQDMAQERLCFKAMKETQAYVAFEMRDALVLSADPFIRAVGLSLVPACIHRYGCPNSSGCGFMKAYVQYVDPEKAHDIWYRFLAYDNMVSRRTIPDERKKKT